MDISTTHDNARVTACRVPALQASLDLLAAAAPEGPFATIALFGTAKPAPGADPGGTPVVTIPLTEAAGSVVGDPGYQLQIAVPIEAQIDGADATLGTIPLWARIYSADASWWGDITVTVEGGGGEAQLVATGLEGDPAVPVARLYNGAFARLTSIIFQG
jgi:hypothetical protein